MLFNSYTFALLFLPLTLVAYFAAGRWLGQRAAIAWLVFASLLFYGWWNPEHVGLLSASLAFNYAIGRELARARLPQRARAALFGFGVIADVASIAYYKYAGFFADTVSALAGVEWRIEGILLPLAISFFTFQQIAYLVDAWRGHAPENKGFLDYCLFVTFFPQLIAGPIVHHAEILPQFRERETFVPRADNIAVGASYFFVGLFKKVVLADGVAVFAQQVFAFASNGGHPTFAEAWIGALAYTLQLYFDFSAYSDMAIGAARLFGVRLPLNFDSPYKALDIADFWRRWHITLSRFLRDYLYIPLGGNRRGELRRHANLMATMLIGGLWHGAGWTFVVWGGLHGAFLVVHRIWRRSLERWKLPRLPRALSVPLAWSATMLAVVVAWVFFRAESFDAAWRMLAAMSGMNGLSIESAVGRKEPALWILGLTFLCVAMPNTAELFSRERPIVDAERLHGRARPRLEWRPSIAWAVGIAALAAVSILSIHHASEFLYFRF